MGELEYTIMEITSSEQQANEKKKKSNIQDLWENILHANIPEGEKQEKGSKHAFE